MRQLGVTPAGVGMLTPDEIPLWWLATEQLQSVHWLRWTALLDADERERANRFWLDRDRRDFIAAHALLRLMLARYLGLPAKDWRFSVGPHGKPAIASGTIPAPVSFSLAHTKGLITAAMSACGRIGVDAEEIDPTKADLANAETYFAPSEVELLRRASPREQHRCFFRLWTLKEAFLKAIGTGLGTPLDSFAFTFDPIRIAFKSSACRSQDWHFTLVSASDAHMLAVAVERPMNNPWRLVPHAASPQEITAATSE